jgi:hypothetical protein
VNKEKPSHFENHEESSRTPGWNQRIWVEFQRAKVPWGSSLGKRLWIARMIPYASSQKQPSNRFSLLDWRAPF